MWKDEVFERVLDYVRYSKRDSQCRLRTENGEEYVNKGISSFLKFNGIRREASVTHCPEQCEVAERAIGPLVEKSRSRLAYSSLGKCFSTEAVDTACRLEKVSSAVASHSEVSPEEAWTGRKSNLSYLCTYTEGKAEKIGLYKSKIPIVVLNIRAKNSYLLLYIYKNRSGRENRLRNLRHSSLRFRSGKIRRKISHSSEDRAEIGSNFGKEEVISPNLAI